MKTRYKDLSAEERDSIKGGCGAGKMIFFIPQFIFRASCIQHDFRYAAGGGMTDKLKADLYFYALMLHDICEHQTNFFFMVFYYFMASTYFTAVTVFGCLFFRWGPYRSKESILKRLS